jgi:hypothetical protein
MQPIKYISIKEEGKSLRVVNSKLLKADCDRLPKGKYRLTIEKYRKDKSNPQLGYLFACIYPYVLKGLNDAGWEFTNLDQVDAKCKELFSDQEVLNRDTGEIMKIPALKRNMTTTEMVSYISAIRSWAGEYLKTVIPEPDTQTNFDFNEDQNTSET